MIRVLTLTGDAFQQGWQHGQQVRDLLPQLQEAMRVRLALLGHNWADLAPRLLEIDQVWSRHAPSTLAMLHGIASALELEWEEFFAYTVGSYLVDQLKHTASPEGCTTWAAAASVTRDGAPLLAKNRDFRPAHQELQCLARVQPDLGYPYLCLTSAGSPGIYSSGINAAGLAVADTHVASRNTGPGIARYSLMLDLLEKFSTVNEAEAYMRSVPHFGDGTVIVADAQGEMAVFELAHSVQAVRSPELGFIVSTNHFSAPETQSLWVDTDPPRLQGNSAGRRRVVEAALQQDCGQVDVAWSQALMARHGDELSAICRHPEMEADAVSIASVVYLPSQATLYISNGRPCQTTFERFTVT